MSSEIFTIWSKQLSSEFCRERTYNFHPSALIVIFVAPHVAMTVAMANYGKQWPWIASSCHFERMADECHSADTDSDSDSPARQTTTGEEEHQAFYDYTNSFFFMAHMRLIEMDSAGREGVCGGAAAGAGSLERSPRRSSCRMPRNEPRPVAIYAAQCCIKCTVKCSS